MSLIPVEYADRIYDILVTHCGAKEAHREAFIDCASVRYEITEYRVCDALGFGGKFCNNSEWFVSCFPQDSNEHREKIIEVANAELSALRAEFLQAEKQDCQYL